MKFRIIGANRETGEDVKMVIEAPDRMAAEQWASENDIIWSEVSPQITSVGSRHGKNRTTTPAFIGTISGDRSPIFPSSHLP